MSGSLHQRFPRTLRHDYDKRKGVLLTKNRRAEADSRLSQVVVASLGSAVEKKNHGQFLFRGPAFWDKDAIVKRLPFDRESAALKHFPILSRPRGQRQRQHASNSKHNEYSGCGHRDSSRAIIDDPTAYRTLSHPSGVECS